MASAQEAEKYSIQNVEFDSKETFVKEGRRCATHSLSLAQMININRRVQRFRQQNADVLSDTADQTLAVPVHFHVIHNGDEGKIPESMLEDQLTVLNDAYSAHKISFTKASVDYTDNADWFVMDLETDAEKEAKTALVKEPTKALNFYTCEPPGGTLGWATFPWELSSAPEMDGVVLLHSSLPGGAASSFNEGDTAVHEFGHWVGLFHTFGESPFDPCMDTDQVADTPAHQVNFGTPPDSTDTCPGKPGKDPVHNYMNYVDDAHMDHLTPGQVERFREQLALFRSELFSTQTRQRLRVESFK